MSREIYIRIGIKDGDKDSGIEQIIEHDKYPYDKWLNISFDFKLCSIGNKSKIQSGQVSVTPTGYITVKERWYHRLIARIYSLYVNLIGGVNE